jgi:hypothetical protein
MEYNYLPEKDVKCWSSLCISSYGGADLKKVHGEFMVSPSIHGLLLPTSPSAFGSHNHIAYPNMHLERTRYRRIYHEAQRDSTTSSVQIKYTKTTLGSFLTLLSLITLCSNLLRPQYTFIRFKIVAVLKSPM